MSPSSVLGERIFRSGLWSRQWIELGRPRRKNRFFSAPQAAAAASPQMGL
jgi:hypothetical protein